MITAQINLSGYKTSRDYEWLADEMQHRSVICTLSFRKPGRWVAQTVWRLHRDGTEIWEVSVEGFSYIYEYNRADFIAACAAADLEAVLRPD